MCSVGRVSASRNAEPDVVEHAAVAEEAVVLGDDADVSQSVRRHPACGALEHVPVVLVGPAEIGVEAGEDPEQRALADPLRPVMATDRSSSRRSKSSRSNSARVDPSGSVMVLETSRSTIIVGYLFGVGWSVRCGRLVDRVRRPPHTRGAGRCRLRVVPSHCRWGAARWTRGTARARRCTRSGGWRGTVGSWHPGSSRGDGAPAPPALDGDAGAGGGRP